MSPRMSDMSTEALLKLVEAVIKDDFLPAILEEATRRVVNRVLTETVEAVRPAARDAGRLAARDWLAQTIGREWTVSVEPKSR